MEPSKIEFYNEDNQTKNESTPKIEESHWTYRPKNLNTTLGKKIHTEARKPNRELSFSINLEKCIEKYVMNSSEYQST